MFIKLKSVAYIALVGALASCSTQPLAMETRMVNHELRVDGTIFSFRVPSNESVDYPRQNVLDRIETISAGGRFIDATMIEKYWDFRNGSIGINKDGTASFKFRVREFTENYEFQSTDFRSLEKYVLAEIDKSGSERNRRLIKSGYSHMAINPPGSFDVVKLNGADALHYRLTGGMDYDAYLIPLSPKVYVQIQFNFIDNSRGKGNEWRKKAQKTADEILTSIKISKN